MSDPAVPTPSRAPSPRRLPGAWRRRLGRAPVVLQLNRVECGAACLATVLSYHGRPTSVRACRERCAAGRGGVSAAALVRAARSYGLEVRAVRVGAGEVEGLRLPAIAHWNGDHFVVVERVARRRVDVIDPAWGRRRLSREDFAASFSGTLLLLEPGPEFAAGAGGEPPAWRVMGAQVLRLPRMRRLLVQILVATLLLQVFGLALPLATKVLVDSLLARSVAPGARWVLGAGLVVAVLAALVTRFLRSALLLRLQARLDWEVLTGFAAHLFRLPLRYFQQRATGDILTRLASVAGLRDLLANQALATALDAALVTAYLVVMFVFTPVLGALVLVIVLLQGVLLLATRGRARDLMAREVGAQVGVNNLLVQSLAGIATIKANGGEAYVVDDLRARVGEWTSHTVRRIHLSNWLDAIESALRMLTPLSVLWVGIGRAGPGPDDLSVGTVLAMTWLSTAVVTTLSSVVTSVVQLQMTGLQIERIGDITLSAPERSGGRALPSDGAAGAGLELRAVTFRYEPGAPPAVRALSQRVEPGQRVAIVGHSGAGKTTLAWLLLGLVDPDEGEVLFDGVPVRELDPTALRRRFGVVLQEGFAIGATIRENIALARPDATPEDVERAARLAELHDEVTRLPLGYATPLAERGVGLSGGQLQRLSIARALVGRPAVLLLDEATSHLDGETEARIVRNLSGIDCTQVIIAHRLSTVREADAILVLRDGELVETGTHAALLERGGTYAALVRAQLGRPPDAQPPAAQPPAADPPAVVGGAAPPSRPTGDERR